MQLLIIMLHLVELSKFINNLILIRKVIFITVNPFFERNNHERILIELTTAGPELCF